MNERHREILKSLLQMAHADGQLMPQEREMLARLLAEVGGTIQELDEVQAGLRAAPEIAQLDKVLPDHLERLDILKRLMRMSMCDGNISFTEFAYLATMAERLKVSQAEMERLRDEVLAE